ncbi:CDP-alcohol phosphatidyltransferase family protein [Chelativorans sp. Marseille-P2723]|uniref:CDP-alcohol phosphatidyltransferase family protein n=1 Tax=Chelativorans sp. Marseille-P2723 TaxID=2709133 RepID=UPI00156DE6DD|nr:CDP-alcohol phosphatidyltransferase family protein [Chelativorans sp. Marseille-P2723]
MIDGWAHKKMEPLLSALARPLSAAGVSANAITAASLATGLAAGLAIALGRFWLALLLILLSRLGDGLDGAVARIRGGTDLGGYMDIVFDFVYYGAIPLGFIFYDPATNGIAGAVLLFSFYVNGASFLAYAVIAEKRGMSTNARGRKSFFFTTGLAEAGETLVVFALACLWPQWFPLAAYVFAVVTLYTTGSRVVLASRVFR